MSRDNLLERMANNPAAGWSIGDLKTVASRHGIGFRQGATSHVVSWTTDEPWWSRRVVRSSRYT